MSPYNYYLLRCYPFFFFFLFEMGHSKVTFIATVCPPEMPLSSNSQKYMQTCIACLCFFFSFSSIIKNYDSRSRKCYLRTLFNLIIIKIHRLYKKAWKKFTRTYAAVCFTARISRSTTRKLVTSFSDYKK